MNVSVTDLKKNYERLNVEFDLWKGEADAQKYIPDMVQMLKEEGYARYERALLWSMFRKSRIKKKFLRV